MLVWHFSFTESLIKLVYIIQLFKAIEYKMYNFFKKSYLNSYLTSTVIRIAICHLTNAIKFILSFVHIHFLILYLNIYKLEYKINPKSYIDHIIIIFSSTVSKTSWENLIHNKNWIIFEIQYYNINAWKILFDMFFFWRMNWSWGRYSW